MSSPYQLTIAVIIISLVEFVILLFLLARSSSSSCTAPSDEAIVLIIQQTISLSDGVADFGSHRPSVGWNNCSGKDQASPLY